MGNFAKNRKMRKKMGTLNIHPKNVLIGNRIIIENETFSEKLWLFSELN